MLVDYVAAEWEEDFDGRDWIFMESSIVRDLKDKTMLQLRALFQ